MSSETLEQHWGRHQRAHVESLNKQIEGTEFEEMSLEDIVVASYNKGDPLPSFKHAAQVFNLNACNVFGTLHVRVYVVIFRFSVVF